MTVVFIDTSEILRTHLIYRRQSITVCEMSKYSKRELVGMKGRVERNKREKSQRSNHLGLGDQLWGGLSIYGADREPGNRA